MTDRRDPLRRAARRRPGAPAVEWDDGRWSWAELDRRVDETTGRLRRLGVQPGDRVALVLETAPAAVTLVHAASRAEAVPVPLSPRLTSRELGDALEALAPVLLLCDSGSAEAARAGGDRVGVAVRPVGALGPAGAELLEGVESAPGPDAWPTSDRVRAVVWTSGTSGRPRGVLITEGNFEASAAGARERLGLGPDDRWHASLSVAHVGGLALVDRAARIGCALVVDGPFDPERFLALADAGRVSHASLVPVMLRRLLDVRRGRGAPEGLRTVLVGGARAAAPLVEEALAGGWPVALTYGMTETCSQVATASPALVRRKPGTVGPPLPGVEVRIAGDGEIRVRGATVAAGYVGGEALDLDDDGWLRTGDLGEVDGEGHLRVVGRRAERIVSGGVNVDALEVEGALREAPGVEDAVVVGLPDSEWGERVAAAVVAGRPGAAARDELDAYLRRRLSGPKRPRSLVFVDALPRNRTGKVDRRAVAALFEDRGGE